ncbi:uncharacterized protein V1516DRAFT_668026 [Lipomyces oligophaga]|uniref:uncharacterized protein n=1 Tax=Lipomyces oligophaga TaxID=45792 RepID=UPI0034CF7148
MARGSAARRANLGALAAGSASSSSSSLTAPSGSQLQQQLQHQQQQQQGDHHGGDLRTETLRKTSASTQSLSSGQTSQGPTQMQSSSTMPTTPTRPGSILRSSPISPDMAPTAASSNSPSPRGGESIDPSFSRSPLRKSASFCSDHQQSGQLSSPSPSMRSALYQRSILPPHPLLDSLTIFVLIIQFPKLVVSLVHFLFACLNFAPFSSSSSLIIALTHATPASPSLLTVLFADVSVAIVSIFFLPRMRTIMVDLGSAVIASSLGGGGLKTALYCTSVLQIARLFRQSFILFRGEAFAPSSMSPSPMIPDDSFSLESDFYLENRSVIPHTWDLLYGSAGWISQAIAIHIVGQSITHSIRRMFLENENRLISLPPASSSPGLIGDGYGVDCEAATYSSIAQTPPSTSTAVTSHSNSSSTSKKKKKSGSSNRFHQQSLWSALANTLVLASRESSQSFVDPQLSSTSSRPSERGSGPELSSQSLLSSLISDDSVASGLGYKPTAEEPALFCCVRYILESEVAFEVIPGDNYLPVNSPQTTAASCNNEAQEHSSILPLVPSIFSHSDNSQCPPGSQTHASTALLYNSISVRVNGILWPEVSVQTIVPRLHNSSTGETPRDPTVQRLEDSVNESATTDCSADTPLLSEDESLHESLLVVSGLTPVTEYEVEISKTFKSGRQVTICRTNICTSPKDSSNIASHVQQPSRPLSPVTTLLDTLCTTNETLTEEKLKLKRVRREHSKHVATLRSEIDSLKTRLGTGDRGEERAWRRVLALRELVRRIEEDTENLQDRVGKLTQTEKSILVGVEERRQEWQARMNLSNDDEAIFDEQKRRFHAKEKSLIAEENTINTKKEKLSTRQRKLLAEFHRTDQERNEVWEREFSRRKSEREELARRRDAIQAEFSSAITKMEKGISDIKHRTDYLWQSMAIFNEGLVSSTAAKIGISVPPVSPILSQVAGSPLNLSPTPTSSSSVANSKQSLELSP